MEKLTVDEVLHVANLANIEVTEEEIEKYSKDLKTLIDDIDKIKDVKLDDENSNILVTPTLENATLREDIVENTKNFDEFKQNLAENVGKFVKVPVKNDD